MHSPFQHHLYSFVVWCVCVCGVCVIGNRIQPVCSKYSQCPLNTASALSIQPVPSQYRQCPLNTASALSIQPVPSQYTLSSQYSLCPLNTASALSIQPVPSQYSLCPHNTASALSIQPSPMVGFLRVRLGMMLDWNTSFTVVLLTAGDRDRHTETAARRQQCQTVLLCYGQKRPSYQV